MPLLRPRTHDGSAPPRSRRVGKAIWIAAEMRAGGAYAQAMVSLTAMNETTAVPERH